MQPQPGPRPQHRRARPTLANQLSQRRRRDDRIQRVADGVVGMIEGGLGQPEQQVLLTANAVQVGDQLGLRALHRPAVDLVNQRDEQVDQAVDDLALPDPGQRGEQGEPHRGLVPAKVRGVLDGGPGAPGGDEVV